MRCEICGCPAALLCCKHLERLVDNRSTDISEQLIREFAAANPTLAVPTFTVTYETLPSGSDPTVEITGG